MGVAHFLFQGGCSNNGGSQGIDIIGVLRYHETHTDLLVRFTTIVGKLLFAFHYQT